MIIINHNNEEGGTSRRGVLPFIHKAISFSYSPPRSPHEVGCVAILN